MNADVNFSGSEPVYSPGQIVNQGWSVYRDLAVDAFVQTEGFIQALGNYEIAPISFDNSFTPDQSLLTGFNQPEKPDEPTLNFQYTLPEPLEIDLPDIPDFGDAPERDFSKPPLDFSGQPDELNIPDPADPPEFDDIELPPPPTDLDFPPLPDLITLDIPSKPDLTEHTFDGERPEIDFTEPDTGINFVEEEYESECLDRLKVEIKRMLDTGTGMPAVVEQMVVDRAIAREETTANQAEMEATERWASRGFSLPSGILNRDIERARQNNQNQENTLSREIFVQRRQEEIENFRFAITQGIALENILINKHMQVMQRAFDFARAVADIAFRTFEAKVALYNAAIQGYRVDAEVYRSLIEAESQKLEQFRLEIQAESLKSEINREKVAIYQARLEALNTIVGVYTAQVEAARAVAQKNESEARAYAAQIEGYRARVDAKTAEFQSWATKVQGELGKVQGFEAEVRAFQADVQAFQAENEAKALEPRLSVDIQESRVRQALAQLEHARAGIQAESERIRGEATVFGSKAQMYTADGQIAASESDAKTRQFQAKLEENRTLSELKTNKAQIDIDQALRSANLLISALDGAAKSGAQLSAGMSSAVSLQASISGQDQWSRSFSEIYRGSLD